MRIFCINNNAKQTMLANLSLKKLNILTPIIEIKWNYIFWNGLVQKMDVKIISYKMTGDTIFQDNLSFFNFTFNLSSCLNSLSDSFQHKTNNESGNAIFCCKNSFNWLSLINFCLPILMPFNNFNWMEQMQLCELTFFSAKFLNTNKKFPN